MELVHQLLYQLSHFDQLIRWGGVTLLFIIVFSETGLLAGFFLPGDSILVTAGLLCAVEGVMNIWVLNIALCIAAISGDSVGYLIGKKIGQKLFDREDSLFFKKSYVTKTQAFYDKYGVKTIVIARFVPIIRTFAPTMAGVGNMDYKKFLTYNVLGGIGWVLSMTFVGYFLGRSIPDIDKKIHYIVFIIIFLSIIPIIIEWLKSRKASVSSTAA